MKITVTLENGDKKAACSVDIDPSQPTGTRALYLQVLQHFFQSAQLSAELMMDGEEITPSHLLGVQAKEQPRA
jgi:hypothetical protein